MNRHTKSSVPSIAAKHVQRWISTTFPGSPSDQAVAPRLHNSNSSVDVRSVVQSTAIRLLAHCHAVLHLCDYRNAGKRHNSISKMCVCICTKIYFKINIWIYISVYNLSVKSCYKCATENWCLKIANVYLNFNTTTK